MNSGSGSRRFNTVIFNDGEIVHRQTKKSTLLEGTADEQPQQGNDADVKVKEENKHVFDFLADFNGAFGLMERDEAGMGVRKIQTTPSRTAVALSNYSSPRSVIFPSIYDTPTKQQQRQSAMFRAKKCTEAMGLSLTSFNSNDTGKPISLEEYSIGDKAELNDLLSLDISREDAALEAKSLEVGDAAFILRSDYNWTYAVVIDKAVVPDGQSSLRFEVGADKSRKTFFEAQWGKYVRVIKTTSRAVPGLSYSESRRSDKANQDAVDNTNLARPKPKGILRNKENNPGRKLVERSKSDGDVGHRVQFVQSNTMYYDAESKIFAGRKEDSVMQTPTQLELLTTVCYKKNEAKKKKNRKKKGLERPELATTFWNAVADAADTAVSPSSENNTSTQAKTEVKESESWDVRQLLSKLAQPVFPWRPTDSADKDDAITSEKDIVEESLTIECELRDDEQFHEIHIVTSM